MATIEEAENNVNQAKQQIQAQKSEIQQARTKLQELKGKLPNIQSQKALRSKMSGLKGRDYRRLVNQSLGQIEGQEGSLSDYEQSLTNYEQETLKPLELEIKDYREREDAINQVNAAADKDMVWALAGYGEGYVKEYAQEWLKQQNLAQQSQQIYLSNPELTQSKVDILMSKGLTQDQAYSKLGLRLVKEVQEIPDNLNQISKNFPLNDRIETKITEPPKISPFKSEMFSLVSAQTNDANLSIQKSPSYLGRLKGFFLKDLKDSGNVVQASLNTIGGALESSYDYDIQRGNIQPSNQDQAIKNLMRTSPNLAYFTPAGPLIMAGGSASKLISYNLDGSILNRKSQELQETSQKYLGFTPSDKASKLSIVGFDLAEGGLGLLGLRGQQRASEFQRLEKATPEASIGFERGSGDKSYLNVLSIKKSGNVRQATMTKYELLQTGKNTFQIQGGKGGSVLVEDRFLNIGKPRVQTQEFSFSGKGEIGDFNIIKVNKATGLKTSPSVEGQGVITEVNILTGKKTINNAFLDWKKPFYFERNLGIKGGLFERIAKNQKNRVFSVFDEPNLIKTKSGGIVRTEGDITSFIGGEVKQVSQVKDKFISGVDLLTGKPKYTYKNLGSKSIIEPQFYGKIKRTGEEGPLDISIEESLSPQLLERPKTIKGFGGQVSGQVEKAITKTFKPEAKGSLIPLVSAMEKPSEVSYISSKSIWEGTGLYERTGGQVFGRIDTTKKEDLFGDNIGGDFFIKPKEDLGFKDILLDKTQPSQRDGFKDLTSPKENQSPKVDQYFDNLLNQESKQESKQRTKQISKTIQKSSQTSKSKTKTIPIFPKIEFNKILNKVKSGDEGIFEVFGKRFGKDKKLGTARSQSDAERLLGGFLKGTLGRSGFITSGGKKVKAQTLLRDREFYSSKSDPFKIVQKSQFSLKRGDSQVKEILGFKKSKKKKFSIWD